MRIRVSPTEYGGVFSDGEEALGAGLQNGRVRQPQARGQRPRAHASLGLDIVHRHALRLLRDDDLVLAGAGANTDHRGGRSEQHVGLARRRHLHLETGGWMPVGRREVTFADFNGRCREKKNVPR